MFHVIVEGLKFNLRQRKWVIFNALFPIFLMVLLGVMLVLNKEIDQQKQKIETLRSALANAAESFGENDRRTQSRQIQLNNAQAALNGMERELNFNNTALEKADKGFDEAGDGTGFLILSH